MIKKKSAGKLVLCKIEITLEKGGQLVRPTGVVLNLFTFEVCVFSMQEMKQELSYLSISWLVALVNR